MKMRLIILLSLISIISTRVVCQSIPLDIQKKFIGKDAKQKAKCIDSIASSYRDANPQLSKTISLYNVDFCKKNNLHNGVVKSYLGLSRTYRSRGLYDSSLIYIDTAKAYAFKNNVKEQYGSVYNSAGITYIRMSDYPKASANLFQSIKYSEAIKDSSLLHDALDHLGSVYFYREDYKTACSYYKKSLNYISPGSGKRKLIISLDNIGLCLSNLDLNDSALHYQLIAVKEMEALGDSGLLAEGYINLSSTYLSLKNYQAAKTYIVKAYDINNLLNIEYGQMMSNLYYGRFYIEQGQTANALPYFTTAYLLAEKQNSPNHIKEISSYLAEAYAKMGNYKESNSYLSKYISVIDELYKEENSKAVNELAAKYESEKKQQQIQILTKDSALQKETIKNNKYLLLIYAALAILFVAISIFFIYLFRKKKKDNKILHEKNEAIAKQKNQIEDQKEELQHKNTEITDSINYAKRIQSSVIPSDHLFNSVFPKSFIYFKPKDIVSGDFYWLAIKVDIIYFAVADCTGHGVPGAMMSMLGTSLLNQIISGDKIKSPSQVLGELHLQVLKSLNEDIEHRESKDGMDMALIMINKKENTITFSGAGRPLYYAENNSLEIFKPDKYSIGGYIDTPRLIFNEYKLNIKNGLKILMFTDGVPDQFGGPKGKKFMSKQLQNLIAENISSGLSAIDHAFTNAFDSWKEGYDQTDDVTIAGIEF